MSWQDEAVAEAARVLREYPESSYRQVAEVALRAALPLIEVTPAMRIATASYDQTEIIQAALRACATEGQADKEGS